MLFLCLRVSLNLSRCVIVYVCVRCGWVYAFAYLNRAATEAVQKFAINLWMSQAQQALDLVSSRDRLLPLLQRQQLFIKIAERATQAHIF
jgi:hypothetical protein